MYKALIVDDENMIRTGIERVIPWESLKIDEVFTSSNGFDALKIIEKEHPHILITDINMTEMSGLEMIEKARERKADIKIIVITGYDLFEYVHRSIKMHVNDFFLKPVAEDDLSGAVRRLVDQMEDERQEAILRRTQGSVEQMNLEKHMRDLAHNRAGVSKDTRLLGNYMWYADDPMKIVAVESSQSDSDEDFELLSLKNMCMDFIDRRELGITFQDDDGRVLLTVFARGEPDVTTELFSQLENLLRDEFDGLFRLVPGKTATGFQNLYVSYDDAMRRLSGEKEFLRKGAKTSSTDAAGDFYNEFYNIKHRLLQNADNLSAVLEELDMFASVAKIRDLPTGQVRECCFELVSSLTCLHALQSGKFYEGKLQTLLMALANSNRAEAFTATRDVLSQMLAVSDESMHDIVRQVKAIINESSSESISVISIAARLYISPNYLSRLFKKATGEGCNEYIVRKRIEKAKKLLESTSFPSGKIAGMVGYQDINYFSVAFKKHTGMSPTKYRESLR